jgi:hypothetical protein
MVGIAENNSETTTVQQELLIKRLVVALSFISPFLTRIYGPIKQIR